MHRRSKDASSDWGMIVDNLHESIITTNAEGYITNWNKGAERLFGYTAEEAVGLHAEICHERSLEAMEREIVVPLQRDGHLDIFGKMVRKSGETFDGHMLASLITAPDGTVIGMVGYTLDITERKRAEEELRESEALLAEAQRISRLGRWDYDLLSGAIWCSDEISRLLGLEPQSRIVPFESLMDFIHPDDWLRLEALTRDSVENGTPISYECRLIGADGKDRFAQAEGEAVRDAGGKVVRLVGTTIDVTERKRAEIALQNAYKDLEHRVQVRTLELRTTLETLVEGVVTVDERGTIETFNRSAEAIFGYDSDEVVGQNVRILMPDEHRQKHNSYLQRYLDTGEAKVVGTGREVTGRRKDGSDFDMRLSVGEMQFGDARKFVGTVQDITEHKTAQTALQKSERNLRNLTNLSPVGIYRTDNNGRITYANDRVLKITGIPEETAPFIGDDWRKFVHPDDREQFVSEFLAAVRAKRSFSGEYRFDSPSGPVTWALSQATPEFDQDGNVTGYVGTLTDITERKTAEQQLLIAVQQAEKANRAKSEFLSSMSHELRTPMNAVLGFAQLLEEDRSNQLGETNREFVEEILRSGHHMLELINDVLDLAKIEDDGVHLDLKDQEPQTLIAVCLNMIGAVAEQTGISITSRVPDNDLPLVRVDTLRFRQILLNLLSNAIKYNRTDGKVIVECMSGPNGTLRISVTDTGQGIPKELQDGVFEPFNRLGAESSSTPGTGIGLAVSKQLVERMGGSIGFKSTVGEGTTFWIDVPLAESGAQPAI